MVCQVLVHLRDVSRLVFSRRSRNSLLQQALGGLDCRPLCSVWNNPSRFFPAETHGTRRRLESAIRPEQAFLLFVNQKQVHDLFPTLEMAQEDAQLHKSREAELQIKSMGSGVVRKWNYRYDLQKWVARLPRE